VPKDPTKNIDRYKIEGGHLNEFEFQKQQEELAEQRNQPLDNLIPGTPPEVLAERAQEREAEAPQTTSKKSKKAKPVKKAKPAKKRVAAKTKAKSKGRATKPTKSTRVAAKKKSTKKATKKSTRKSAAKKAKKK
jgi:hypothetical protein